MLNNNNNKTYNAFIINCSLKCRSKLFYSTMSYSNKVVYDVYMLPYNSIQNTWISISNIEESLHSILEKCSQKNNTSLVINLHIIKLSKTNNALIINLLLPNKSYVEGSYVKDILNKYSFHDTKCYLQVSFKNLETIVVFKNNDTICQKYYYDNKTCVDPEKYHKSFYLLFNYLKKQNQTFSFQTINVTVQSVTLPKEEGLLLHQSMMFINVTLDEKIFLCSPTSARTLVDC